MKNLCGKKLGKILTFGVAMFTGEEDLAANQLEDEQNLAEGGKTRLRRFIKIRMVASQAVASEFVVTGCFLVISAGTYMREPFCNPCQATMVYPS